MPLPRNSAWLLLAGTITLQLVVLRSVRVLKHDAHLFDNALVRRGDVPNVGYYPSDTAEPSDISLPDSLRHLV